MRHANDTCVGIRMCACKSASVEVRADQAMATKFWRAVMASFGETKRLARQQKEIAGELKKCALKVPG